MTCTDKQVKILMKNLNKYTQEIAAAKAGMSVKTARKYIRSGKLPSEIQVEHNWRTREDVFKDVREEIEEYLNYSPRLQAKTMLNYLIQKYPGKFQEKHLRTLQRRFRDWRAEHGKGKEVIFVQIHYPGKQSQSDYTDMNELGITIKGQKFEHLLYHFVLTYSKWESINICYSESFDSLVAGFEKAVWELGGLTKEHRTDNLTAAVKKDGNFTERWEKVVQHYGINATKNNPGQSNENGVIEKNHDLIKTAVDQQLMLRGSRNFNDLEEYRKFLEKIVKNRNISRKNRVEEELNKLKELPDDKWYSPTIRPIRVTPQSIIHIDGVPYSVPSRLISYTLRAHIYPDEIVLYYGYKKLQAMEKTDEGVIDYRHIIDNLIRKPGAFKDYKYKAALFPCVAFRKAYDLMLQNMSEKRADKEYLQLLNLAKLNGEQNVFEAIKLLIEANRLPLAEEIKNLLDVPVEMPNIKIKQPNLADYDRLKEVQ